MGRQRAVEGTCMQLLEQLGKPINDAMVLDIVRLLTL